MDTPRWEQKLGSYAKALKRLKEIVVLSRQRELTEIEKDGLIQRFEFTHELAWKLMMSFCKCQSPEIELFGSKDSTRWAFEHGLISGGDIWMEMIASRNMTSHNYDGDIAEEVFFKIVNVYYKSLIEFYNKMRTFASEPILELSDTE